MKQCVIFLLSADCFCLFSPKITIMDWQAAAAAGGGLLAPQGEARGLSSQGEARGRSEERRTTDRLRSVCKFKSLIIRQEWDISYIFNWYPTPGKMKSRRSYSLTELNSCLTEKTALAITKANDTVHASWKYIKMHDFNQELDNTNSPVCGWQAQPRSCRIPTR